MNIKYCDRCADKLDPFRMIRVVMQEPHFETVYYFCKPCAAALVGFSEGGAAE